jgi:predicted thioesterase
MEQSMDLDGLIQPGMSREETYLVEEQHSALTVGSGSAQVLATPWLIAFAERAAHRLLAGQLPAGSSSVGVLIDIRHSAPTPVGSRVHVKVEVTEINGLWVTFAVRVKDDFEPVGEGCHQRVVIDEARFARRVEAKQPPGN